VQSGDEQSFRKFLDLVNQPSRKAILKKPKRLLKSQPKFVICFTIDKNFRKIFDFANQWNGLAIVKKIEKIAQNSHQDL